MLRHVLATVTLSLIIAASNAQPPKAAMIAYKNAVALKEKSMYPEALLAARKAVSLYKKYDSAYVQMGDIFLKLNQFDSALSSYNKALAINPRQLIVYITLGNLYKNSQTDLEKAISNFLEATKIDSTNKETFCNIAWCYNTSKKYDKAIIYAVKALDLDPDNKGALGELGHAYHYSKKYSEGLEKFKKIMAVSKSPLPIYYAGMCCIELKDKEQALKMYDALNTIDSGMAQSFKKSINRSKL